MPDVISKFSKSCEKISNSSDKTTINPFEVRSVHVMKPFADREMSSRKTYNETCPKMFLISNGRHIGCGNFMSQKSVPSVMVLMTGATPKRRPAVNTKTA
jgi:hypothetical protein